MVVLGLDYSIRNTGWVKLSWVKDNNKLSLIDYGVIHRAKTPSSIRGVNRRDFYQAHALGNQLQFLINGCDLVTFELSMGGTGRALKTLNLVTGLVACLPLSYEKLISVSPYALKRHVTGDKFASKENVITWAKFVAKDIAWDAIPKGKHEHIADALASVYAGLKIDKNARIS